MHILIVHNKYGNFSGEEAVIDKLSMSFSKRGHVVDYFFKSSEKCNSHFLWKMIVFFTGFYSFRSNIQLQRVINQFKPDIINIHNLYPFISPSILRICKKNNIPIVMTVHNYRLICPTGLFMRNHRPCELCLVKKHEWNCIWHNCERSLPKSIGYALRNMFARKRRMYLDNVDYFACLTNFQREKIIAAGFNPKKVLVIPNFINISRIPDFTPGAYVAYSGRLSEEKGVDLILKVARKHPEIHFKFAGNLRDKALLANGIPSNCEFLGYLSGNKLEAFYNNASFFVMASKWYEGFPMTILEAAGYGKCTVAPSHGGFIEIIGKGDKEIGRLFRPMDVIDLENQITNLWNNPDYLVVLNKRAFEKVRTEYSTDNIYDKYIKVFTSLTKL